MELFPQQIVALLFVAAGLVTVIHVVRTTRRVQAARGWPSVKGRVNTSVVKRSGGRNRVYRAKIRYTYSVGGREHEGRRYALGGELDTSSRERADERCARYPEGSEPDVYYDPTRPSDSCLVREQEGATFTILIGGVFTAVGVAILLGLLPGT